MTEFDAPERHEWRWLKPEAVEETARLKRSDPSLYGRVYEALRVLTSLNCSEPGHQGAARCRWLRVGFDHDPGCAFVLFVIREDRRGLGGLLLATMPSCPSVPPDALFDLARQRLARAPGGW